MRRPLPAEVLVEFAVCIAGGALTATWRNWIEQIVGFEPDGGDGSTK